VDGQSVGKTPVTLKLDRTGPHQIRILKDGIERTYVLNRDFGAEWIVLDILGGLVPLIIDAATGSWYDLSPNYINAQLVPGAKHQAYKGTGKIGIRIQNQIVIAVTSQGPADRAGVQVGDKILVADGVELNGEESLHDVSLITGEPGTTVTLTIQRDDQVFEISVVRE
jgi:membrane-associated protease RseP (regulator of RpoE activity)